MPTYLEILTIFKDFMPLITAGGGAAVITFAGFVPRVGPGRAFWIAFYSRFFYKPKPMSIRSAEITEMRRRIAEKAFEQDYLVITGEKGVGKTCLVNTATSKTPGVIKVEAMPGNDADMIVKKSLHQLTRIEFWSPFNSARRVIFWHRCFTGQSPVIVISATEREAGEKYAGLASAVRTLVDNYHLRVVVDGSPNSLPETLLQTKRESVFDIKPMTKDMIWQLEQFQELFVYVKKASLDNIVFAVLGGNPADYKNLWKNTKTRLQTGQDPRQIIGDYLRDQIYAAANLVRKAKKKTNDMEKIIELFDTDKKFILCNTLDEKKLERPTPDKIFREVEQKGVAVLVPASNAIGIVLQYELKKKPTLDELEEMVKQKA